MFENQVIVRFDNRLISINTLKSLLSPYWFNKIWLDFIHSPKQSKRYKLYNGPTIVLIYR